jgi:SAM-dependent methyltransferase
VAKRSQDKSVHELRERWRAFARANPLEAAVVGSSARHEAAFFASGAKDVEGILAFVRPVARRRALDLGCGPGRLLPALAREFRRVDGVDIAPEMLEAAKLAPLPDNVHLGLASGTDLAVFEDDAFDLVIALLVFQHIPDDAFVQELLGEVHRVLAHHGRAFLQFDSRPDRAVARLIQRLPDAMLPSIRRRYMRRYRRKPEDIDELLVSAGLRVMREEGRGTGSHHICVSRLA